MTTVTAVTAFRSAEAVCKTSSRSSRPSRGAGCPFQRAALLGEPSADGGGNAPTPPRRAQMRF